MESLFQQMILLSNIYAKSGDKLKIMEKNIELSIVIPCYNEGANIPLVVKRFEEVFPDKINLELILVDNGSTDNSKKIIQELMNQYSYIKTIRIDNNIGYGFGIYSGLKVASGKYVCWTHADMQTDIYDTIKAYNIILQQDDSNLFFVKGKRKGRPIFDTFFTLGMAAFESVLLGSFLYDINAQPNLFPKKLLENICKTPNDFSFDLFMYYMAKKKKYKIIRFPVKFIPRLHGQSHWNTGIIQKVKFINRTFLFSFKLKKEIKTYEKAI